MTLSPIAQKFLISASKSEIPPDKNLEALHKFDQQLRASFTKQQQDNTNFKPINSNSALVHFRPSMKFCGLYVQHFQDQIWENIKNSTKEMVNANIEFIKYLSANGDKTVKAQEYTKACIQVLQNNPEFVKLMWHKRSLENLMVTTIKAHPSRDPAKMIKVTIQKTFLKYDEKERYVPQNPFDIVLPYYLQNNAKYKKMIDAIVEQISEQSVQSALVTIAEFTDQIRDEILAKGDPEGMRVIIYIGVVRYLFNEAYCARPILSSNGKANMQFLNNCQLLSSMTVKSISLPESIKSTFTPNLPVKSIFKEPLLKSLNGIDFMLNPIDILVRVNRARIGIQRTFKGLTEKDLKNIFTVLIAVNPPLNGVNIAVFLKKWGEMKLTNEMQASQALFVQCVQTIFEIGNDDEDEEEEEEENEEE